MDCVKAYAFSLMEIKWHLGRAFFFLLLSVNTLEQWSVDEWDIAEVTFAYLNITSANFNRILTAILQVMVHI